MNYTGLPTKDDTSETGFLPEQIWVSLPEPTDLPLSD